jgi:hypothetical protein
MVERRYIGADVLCGGLEYEEDRLSVYISFGDYVEEIDCDSFGIPDSRIYQYLTYREFMNIVDGNGDPELDEYYRVLNYELVEDDRE